jgi:23S rRNA A2030 N6-methylase RlmJ
MKPRLWAQERVIHYGSKRLDEIEQARATLAVTPQQRAELAAQVRAMLPEQRAELARLYPGASRAANELIHAQDRALPRGSGIRFDGR